MATIIVIAPKNPRIKEGSVFLGVKADGRSFFIIGQYGAISRFCLYTNCAHLDFADWKTKPTIKYWREKLNLI